MMSSSPEFDQGMDTAQKPGTVPPGAERSSEEVPLSPGEVRAQRVLWISTGVVILIIVLVIALLIYLSTLAYQSAMAGAGPTPGEVVMSLLRDAAIVFVAFEALLIGLMMIVLMLQMRALVALLQNEIKPMLESVNETLDTVRGTTQFVSHNVVSPVMKWSGYLAGIRRFFSELTGLAGSVQQNDDEQE